MSFTTLEKFGLVAVTIVGFQIVCWILRFLNFLYTNVVAPKFKWNATNLQDMGTWAVVTGATDGLGKAYADLLAKKGMNVVLISRSREKLESVAAEIGSTHGVDTKIISADFTDESVYYAIEKQLTGLDVGILINNVGMSYPYPEYLLDLKNGDDIYRDIIKCNILSVTNMCRIALLGMAERGKGVIVNVSSVSADIPSPMLSVYSASKAYVNKFSDDLQAEYSKKNIVVQCLMPGYVATKMSKIKQPTWMAPSPKKFVSRALRTVGISQRTTGYFPHTLLVKVVHLLDAISPKLSRWFILRTMENIKTRALRRNQQ